MVVASVGSSLVGEGIGDSVGDLHPVRASSDDKASLQAAAVIEQGVRGGPASSSPCPTVRTPMLAEGSRKLRVDRCCQRLCRCSRYAPRSKGSEKREELR